MAVEVGLIQGLRFSIGACPLQDASGEFGKSQPWLRLRLDRGARVPRRRLAVAGQVRHPRRVHVIENRDRLVVLELP